MSSSPRRLLAVCGAVLAVGLFGAGCSSTTSASTPAESPEVGAVNATLKEFEIAIDPASASGPEITFSISNTGTITHEFVVFKTDLAPDAMPTDAEGLVNEEGEGVELQGEVEDIAVGATESLSLPLDPGNYVLLCNLPDHYSGGMHIALTVT
jgi:uncharacterized cupredoxin-like copper-binding protein